MKKAEIERDGARVTISVQCSEIYEAMHLYEELITALKIGHATLSVTVISPTIDIDVKEER
jgi:hypothetical protein